MSYEKLYDLYYKDEKRYKQEYESRFNSSTSKHLPINIKQYNYRTEHEAFYYYIEDMFILQEKIMSKLSLLTALLEDIPPVGVQQFIRSSLIEEIKSSNDIEGVRSTRKEIDDAITASYQKRNDVRLSGIVNKFIHVLNNERINLQTSSDIRLLFDEIMADEVKLEDPNDLPDGKIFRAKGVSIISETQKIIHEGITPEEKIIDYVDTALNILNDESIPTLVRIAIFHYLFGYIHPFYNGNGRMSRFITAVYIAKHLHPTIALQLSLQIKKQRRQYYKLFSITDSDRNKGDLTPFILGTLKFILNAIEVTYSSLNLKYNQYQLYYNILLTNIPTNIIDIVHILLQATIFSDDGITLSELKKTSNLSENTIRTHLRKIPAGILKYDTTSKPYNYSLDLGAILKLQHN